MWPRACCLASLSGPPPLLSGWAHRAPFTGQREGTCVDVVPGGLASSERSAVCPCGLCTHSLQVSPSLCKRAVLRNFLQNGVK